MVDTEHERSVVITQAAEVIETRTCRVMTMPDGRRGALWGGLVFPLGSGDRIDLAGEAVPPGDCRPGPTVGRARYALIPGASESYVLVDADRETVDAAVKALSQAGVTVLRAGRYLGEPPEGIEADWFIRVADAPADRVDAILASLLWTTRSDTPEGPLDLRLRLLEADLLAARAREAALHGELAQLRLQAATSGEEADLQRALMEEALGEERRLRAEVEARAAEPVPHTKPAARLREEIAAMLAGLLPRMILLRDSEVVITAEFASRRALWRSLGELNGASGAPHGWKKIRGAERWWERHVSNGQDDSGRIYARHAAGEQWEILVSHKTEQPRDIAWLSRQ